MSASASPLDVLLTLKAPFRTAADNIHKYFFIFFLEKIRLDVSSESSARQRIHMKNEALFSLKDKSKKLKCGLLQFLFDALRIIKCFLCDGQIAVRCHPVSGQVLLQ